MSINNNKELLERLECMIALENMTDDDIDYSDIPEVTDFSNWRPARDHLKRIAQWNYEHRAEIAQSLREKILADKNF